MRKQSGFTLIELMIVVVIIGIISAIAYPAYTNQMRRTNRTDAYAGLTRMASLQDTFRLANQTYTANPADVGGTATSDGLYTLAVTFADANTYTLTATAVAGSMQAGDTGCTVITLTAAGQRTPANCW